MERLEDKLIEAACVGDRESLENLLKENINVNTRQKLNGWTPLHWACKKEYKEIVKVLIQNGADINILNNENETAADVCPNSTILDILRNGENLTNVNYLHLNHKYLSNFKRNSVQTDPGRPRILHSKISNMPTTMLPTVQDDALEDWLYRNNDLKRHHILLLWQSDPCVVIGRHQNPFLEANIAGLKAITNDGVVLSRRNSGGGTVYHDNGNLNLSFFTTKECYNRKHNLEIITQAISKEYGVTININEREDLVIDNYKVSGTAAKLGRPNAYHHCTLLVKVNRKNLAKSLRKCNLDIETNAMKSVPSKIMNLTEKNPDIKIDRLIKAIGIEYMQTPAYQGKHKEVHLNIPRGFKFIEPLEEEFPGITEIRKNLSSWKWIFGKTPKFIVKYHVHLPQHFSSVNKQFNLDITVEDGVICDIKFGVLDLAVNPDIKKDMARALLHQVFNLDILKVVKKILIASLKSKWDVQRTCVG